MSRRIWAAWMWELFDSLRPQEPTRRRYPSKPLTVVGHNSVGASLVDAGRILASGIICLAFHLYEM